MLSALTANPYKFAGALLESLGKSIEGVDDLAQLKILNDLTNLKILRNLVELADVKILYTDVCNPDEMAQRVLKFAAE